MEKKIFSISKKNQEVLYILNSLNKNEVSEFICQAIIEKAGRKEPEKINKAEIRLILEEILREKNMIIQEAPKIVEETKKEPDKTENENLILSIMDSWDDE